MDSISVMIGIPHMGMWHAKFATNLINMNTAFHKYRVGDAPTQALYINHVQGSTLPRSRSFIVQEALKLNATHLLFLDCDHTFPRNLLHRLLMHKKDIVAINCPTKTIPSSPTARYKPQKPDDPVSGIPVYSDPDKHGLEQVWRVGTGIMLVRMNVFHRIGRKVFDMFWHDEVEDYQGEDWTMVTAMDAAGYKIYVDHDLSRECGHIGFFTYTHDHIGEIVRESVDSNIEVPNG